MSFYSCFVLWIFFFLSQTLFGQTGPKSHAYTFGAKVYKGYIIKHSASIGNLAISHPQGISLFLNQHTFGKKYCEQAYHYPDIGIALSYFNYLNPVLGKSFALTTYLDIPVKQFSKSEVIFKLGTGLAYHTHPHDQTYNNSNIALGSRITYSMVTGVKYTRQISEKWRGGLSLSMTHFSNGAFTKPNTGINIPTLDLEVSREIVPVPLQQPGQANQHSSSSYSGYYYYLGASTGIKAIVYGGDQYAFYNLHFQAGRRFNAISAIMLGMDGFYDEALKAIFGDEHHHSLSDNVRIGMVIGHELFYGRISLITQLGIHIYRPSQDFYGAFYQRYGLRYALTHYLVSSISLKAYGGQAEAVEWGIGIKL